MSNNTYEAVHRLLATPGIVILHRVRVPVNPVNLFDMLVGEGRRVAIEVDDTFVEQMGNLADDDTDPTDNCAVRNAPRVQEP